MSIFFSGKNLLAKHNIFHRYGLEIKDYKDFDGSTVIYYKENFQSGTGIWWFNYFFYKYDNQKLIPILNQLENANLSFPWHIRFFRFESKVINTNPLALKMVYWQEFPDSTNEAEPIREVLKDSTIITFHWDNRTRTLKGDFKKAKISEEQILSYYLDYNELLYIISHYEILKKSINNKDNKVAVLNYLNEVKKYCQKNKNEK